MKRSSKPTGTLLTLCLLSTGWAWCGSIMDVVGLDEAFFAPYLKRSLDRRAEWIARAEACKPKLFHRDVAPQRLVRVTRNANAYQGWACESVTDDVHAPRVLSPGVSLIYDFGEHLVGSLSFHLGERQRPMDAPCRLKLTFAEMPIELAVSPDADWKGLCRSWFQDEVVNIDFAPWNCEIPRRFTFRYVKVDVVACPAGVPTLSSLSVRAETSADEAKLVKWTPGDPTAAKLDRIARHTLRDCMQTMFEDGPKRDRRLWLGDLRLEALANYATYRNFDVVKRSLYMLAGTTKDNGLVGTDAYERPCVKAGSCRILDYTALFPAVVREYLEASGDRATAEDLWPLCVLQWKLVLGTVAENGLATTDGDWWYFIDHDPRLDREVPEQGVIVYGLKRMLELARALGREREIAWAEPTITRMTEAARRHLWKADRGIYLGRKSPRPSYLGQAWMVIAGLQGPDEDKRCLSAVLADRDAVSPRTPYGYHYFVEALYRAGLAKEARETISLCWGKMAELGADTFWEAFDPNDDLTSPYGNALVNSYCHAWSCGPAYFLRTNAKALPDAKASEAGVDFRNTAEHWQMLRGSAADPQARARQITNVPDGIRVSADAAGSDLKPWDWASINAKRKIPIGDLSDGCVLDLHFRCGTPPLVMGDVSIGISDAKGRGVPWARLPSANEGQDRVLSYKVDFSKMKQGVKPEGPFSLTFINFGMECERGDITFKSLKVNPPARASRSVATLALDVETGHAMHVVRTNLGERATLVFSNTCRQARSWRGTLSFEGPWGEKDCREIAFGLPASGVYRDRLPPFPQHGVWRVKARMTCDDGTSAEYRTRFAQIDLHTVQPKLPFGKYRFGLCYHMSSYHGRDREVTLDALTAIGAQIVRVGGLWYHDYEYVKGQPSWKKADDIVNALEARGLAICAASYANPPWAKRADGTQAATFGPATPGFEGAFHEQLAKRFGERVDYYEIGNEWDLRTAKSFPKDECIRVTRECAEGLKRGCPKARVIPCGWAVESSNHPMVSQKGFQEDVMRACQDVLDVHPIHVHGPWAMHAARMREFFAMREKNGITLPWYANETAVNSLWGRERAAAETLWQKIVWSWAHGSTDYIWYNLRATGTDENDGEQAYGIMTRDYYPRDAFAAFAALSTLLRGFDFAALRERPSGRSLYAFDGQRDGKAERVFVAWDRAGGSGFPLRMTLAPKAGCVPEATESDLYGNRRVCRIANNRLTWNVARSPCALVVRGAETVKPDENDLSANETEVRRRLHLNEHVRIADYERVTEICQANPEMLHRLWKGPSDLSGDISLTRKGDGLEVVLTVTDDKAGKGDRAQVSVDGQPVPLNRIAPLTYQGAFKCGTANRAVSVLLEDDDGEGVDVRLAETFDLAN